MASESSSVVEIAPYPYRGLDGSSIRLIQIADDPTGREPIRCELTHHSLDTTPPPEYIAISYTWGDATDKGLIYVDGHKFPVPLSLWYALYHVRMWSGLEDAREDRGEQGIFRPKRPWLFWADAICINQVDSEEKNREIPRMKKIFGTAKEVFGWLGHRLPPGVGHDMLSEVMDKARDISRDAMIDQTAWIRLTVASEEELRIGLGIDDMQAFTDAVFAIANMPWFKRLWIIQEYAVATAGVALAIGPHIFDAPSFHTLLVLFAHRPQWFLQPVDLACSMMMGRIRERHAYHMGYLKNMDMSPLIALPETTNELDTFAQRLQGLLAQASLAPFESTKQHDMIYGIISMASPPDPMPPELAIDYSLPWSEVCRRYAKFLAERTGSISFLSRVRVAGLWPEGENTQDLPSWVPNFAAMSNIMNHASYYFIERDRYIGSKVTFSEDGSAMTLDAVVLGKPQAFTCRTDLAQRTRDLYDSKSGRSPPFIRAEAREFVHKILAVAADRQGKPLEEVLAGWIGAWEASVDRRFNDSEATSIQETYLEWVNGEGPDLLYLDQPLIAGKSFSERGRAVWRRLKNKTVIKNWLVTADGRGWIALFQEPILAEDTVMVLRGLPEFPALLREDPQKGGYRLLGMLVERVPLSSDAWEHTAKDFLGKGEYPWTRVTIV